MATHVSNTFSSLHISKNVIADFLNLEKSKNLLAKALVEIIEFLSKSVQSTTKLLTVVYFIINRLS